EREISGPQQIEDVRGAIAYLQRLIGLGGRMASDSVDRRTFLGVTAAATAAMFVKPALVRGTTANSAIRVGLLGCGGRGTEDAENLVDTGGAQVVALADLFQDQLDAAHAHFD